MAKYLSEEWLVLWSRALAELPERPGVDARVARVVTGGPDGEATYHLVVAGGRVEAAGLGPDAAAEVTFTSPHDVATALAAGELDPSVAYMQGRLKAEGDTATLHELLALSRDPAWARAVERAWHDTEV